MLVLVVILSMLYEISTLLMDVSSSSSRSSSPICTSKGMTLVDLRRRRKRGGLERVVVQES